MVSIKKCCLTNRHIFMSPMTEESDTSYCWSLQVDNDNNNNNDNTIQHTQKIYVWINKWLTHLFWFVCFRSVSFRSVLITEIFHSIRSANDWLETGGTFNNKKTVQIFLRTQYRICPCFSVDLNSSSHA